METFDLTTKEGIAFLFGEKKEVIAIEAIKVIVPKGDNKIEAIVIYNGGSVSFDGDYFRCRTNNPNEFVESVKPIEPLSPVEPVDSVLPVEPVSPMESVEPESKEEQTDSTEEHF